MFLFDRFGCKLTFEFIMKVSEKQFKIKWVAGLGQTYNDEILQAIIFS